MRECQDFGILLGMARGPNLSDDERAEILRLIQEEGRNITQVSKEIGRSRQTIHTFLASIKATGKLARAHAEAEAYRLMKRVTDEADVDQALEVLDRTDVLPKKREDRSSGGSQFIVCVGMPGQGALSPPTQAEIVTVQQRRLAEVKGDG